MHLSTDGYLGCYHILVIVNRAAMNTEMLISLQDPDFNFFDKYAEVGLLCHMVVLFLMS